MTNRMGFWRLLLVAALICATWATSAFAAADEHLFFNAALRNTGSVKIHANVYNNPGAMRGGATVLAVHGLTEVGSMYEPLARAIFADPILKYRVKRVIAIDLPGHGQSGLPTLPTPTKFGDLAIEDNAGVVIQAIAYLRSVRKGPSVVMGHSMGGIAVQTAQEILLSKRSSLARYGVNRAILIASVPARGTTWTRYPSAPIDPSYVMTSEELGTYLQLPAAICGMSGGFTTLAGTPVASAPDFTTCAINAWMGIEPIAALTQLGGEYCMPTADGATSAGVCRPFVRANAFTRRNGTKLTVLGFSQDVLTPIVDQGTLYTYLTGTSSSSRMSGYRPVVADDAVHSMFVSNPAGMISAIRSGIQ